MSPKDRCSQKVKESEESKSGGCPLCSLNQVTYLVLLFTRRMTERKPNSRSAMFSLKSGDCFVIPIYSGLLAMTIHPLRFGHWDFFGIWYASGFGICRCYIPLIPFKGEFVDCSIRDAAASTRLTHSKEHPDQATCTSLPLRGEQEGCFGFWPLGFLWALVRIWIWDLPFLHPPLSPFEGGIIFVQGSRSNVQGPRTWDLALGISLGSGTYLDLGFPGYVPISHEARYFSCSGNSVSIAMPIDSSFSRAISLSMAAGIR